MYHIFGHRSPDTDAIASAMALQAYFVAQNLPATAYRLGETNTETSFVLDQLNINPPPYLDPNTPKSTLPQNAKICLTDHNEAIQSISNLTDFHIAYVIDHHKLNLSTPNTAYIRIYPVGCTCTILLEMFHEKGLKIDATLAKLMLSAILSDTLNRQSPTTTDSDRWAIDTLANLAGMNDDEVNKFAHEMFLAKSDVSNLTAEQILMMDYKEYDIHGNLWGIAGIETMDLSAILARKDELIKTAKILQEKLNLTHLMIAIVDIATKTGYAISHDDKQNAILAKIFDVEPDKDILTLPNIISRKKQIVPALERYYASTI